MSIIQKLSSLNIILPQAPRAVANYAPFVRSASLLFISGQLPIKDGKPFFIGQVNKDLSVEQAVEAARLCAINILTQIAAAGAIEKVKHVVKLGGFVNATPDFIDHPQIINGASDLMVAVFGDAGRHSRSAVGVSSLPLGVPVEIDAIIELMPT